MKPQLVKAENDTGILERSKARDQVVDEYAPLAMEVSALRSRLRVLTEGDDCPYNKLKATIREWCAGKAPGQKFLYESDKHQLEIGAMENVKTALMQKIFQVIGPTRFIAIVTVTQKALKAELEKQRKALWFDKLFQTSRTGDRDVKAFVKPQEKAA